MNLGAVSYLNMLPFFYDDPEIWRADSPSILNNAVRSGKIDVACMSAVAGLRLGWTPLIPSLGVGARSEVKSVYLEPLMRNSSDEEFWNQFVHQNSNGLLNCPDLAPFGKGTAGTNADRFRQVNILTSGASEQSEWLSQKILGTQALETQIFKIDESLNLAQQGELQQYLESSLISNIAFRAECPTALLVIGDPALERALLIDALRLDLATLWNDYSGLPCIFAIWFARPGSETRNVSDRLKNNIRRWKSLKDKEKEKQIIDFLNSNSNSLRHLTEDSVTLLRQYIQNIRYDISCGFKQTLQIYKTWLR